MRLIIPIMAKKYCPKCGDSIDIRFFAKDPSKRSGLNSYCRTHQKTYQQDWYRRNKDEHIKRVGKRTKLVRAEIQRWILEYLSTHPCVDCGENDPVVLEFDHVRGRKKGAICAMVYHRGFSLKVIKAEVAKCEVRCANCHRRRTAKKFGWFKFIGSVA